MSANPTPGDVQLYQPQEPQERQEPQNSAEPPSEISQNMLQLKNPIPPDAPTNRNSWTVKQAKEFLKREKEQDQIKKMEAKIEAAFIERHQEVDRMNRRRDKHDANVMTAVQRNIQSEEIQARQAAEAAHKKEAIRKIMTGQYP